MLDKGDIMKKLFLIMAVILGIIVLTTPMYAQAGKNMVIFTDTTQLKASEEGGIVLLEQFGGYGTYDRTGGGLFHFADSSIAEGTHAFDHPYTGKQWQRIQYVGGEEQDFNALTAVTIVTTGKVTAGGALTISDGISGVIIVDTAVVAGRDAIGTTLEKDTVVNSGAEATDIYLITPISETIDAQDNVIQATAKEDTLIVTRPASGASGLEYFWLRIKQQ